MCVNYIVQAEKHRALPNQRYLQFLDILISVPDSLLRKLAMFPCTMFIGTRCNLKFSDQLLVPYNMAGTFREDTNLDLPVVRR